MATTLLITEQFIRENTVFNKNVDIKDIVNNIGVAQDMYVEPILGSTFYDSIQAAYSAQTLTANETALVLVIKPFLAYKTAEITLPFLTFNLKNKGPQTQFGDNSASIDMTAFNYLRNEIKNRAEWYGQRLENYLYLNSSLFSGYTSQGSNIDLPPDHSNAYDSNIATYDNYYINCYNGFNGFYRRY